jgi:hypothetical protein
VAPGVDFGQAGKRAVRFSYASSEENIREVGRIGSLAEGEEDEKKIAESKGKGKKLQDKFHLQGSGKVPVDDLLACMKDSLPGVPVIDATAEQ